MTDEQKEVAPAKPADAKEKTGLDGILDAGEKFIVEAKTKPGRVFVVGGLFLVCLIIFLFVAKL
jgi:hypothetical protein